MDQDKTDPAQRPQTLLEAGKAFIGDDWNGIHLRNLRAAIAREEAKPTDFWQSCLDRAQQAESALAWHRSELERLSAQVADMRQKYDAMCSDSYHASIRQELRAWPTSSTVEAAKSLRQRAEKAEAELASKESVTVQQVAFEVAALRRDVDELRRFLPRLGGKS